jgi:hypothetical protein
MLIQLSSLVLASQLLCQNMILDAPASSELTQQRLGWRLTSQPGLIADLDVLETK